MTPNARSIQKLANSISAIDVSNGIAPSGAIGLAIIMIVAADPIGLRDMIGTTISRIIDARYSVVIDATRKVIEVKPET